MLKSELLEKLKDIAEDVDINETIQSIDGLIKPFDVKTLDLDGFKNVLEQNEIAKTYYKGNIDSAVSKGVDSFKKHKMQKYINEAVEKALKEAQEENLTPEQIQLKEAQEEIARYKAKEAEALILEANKNKLKEQGLNTDLARFIKEDADIEFFKNFISDAVQAGVKEKLGGSNYKPPVTGNLNTVTKEQFNKMGYKERLDLFNTNKELYEQLQNE